MSFPRLYPPCLFLAVLLCVGGIAAAPSTEALIIRVPRPSSQVEQARLSRRAIKTSVRQRSLRRSARAPRSSVRSGVGSSSVAKPSPRPRVRITVPSSSAASSSAQSSAVFDPRTDASVLSNVLVLGEVSPAIAGVKFFSTSEPISAERIVVQLIADVPTVESMLVYDSSQRFLGTATKESGTLGRFVLRLQDGALALPHKQEVSIYVRARVKSYDYGGESGQTVQVSTVDVEGTGDWSNTDYVQSSTETFPGFETARGVPTVIRNAGTSDAVLVAGSNQLLAEFRFEGRETDGEADVRLMQLRITVDSGSGVTLSNVQLRVDGLDTPHACTIAAPIVTCSSIPATIGSLESTRVIRVYGGVVVAAGALNTFLRLSLNSPGTISASGDVRWTDGSTNFSWVPFQQPIARGTLFR